MNKRNLKRNMPYVLMVLPMCALFFIFFILPVLNTVYYSFFNWTNYSPEITFNGWKNYIGVLHDKGTVDSILNTFEYTFLAVFFQNIIALPAAVVLCGKLRLKNVYRSVFFAPAVLSPLVVGYLWSYIMSSSESGLLNSILGLLHIAPVNWLGNAKLAMFSIIATQVWQWFGWCMVIYIGNLQTIPKEYYEAAQVDGANTLQTFFRITFPLLTPALKVNVITGLISGLKVFDIIFSLTKGGPGHATDTLLTSMFKNFSMGNYGYTSAFGTVFLIISLCFAALLLNGFKKWEEHVS